MLSSIFRAAIRHYYTPEKYDHLGRDYSTVAATEKAAREEASRQRITNSPTQGYRGIQAATADSLILGDFVSGISTSFRWPATYTGNITAFFDNPGYPHYGNHKGIDIAAPGVAGTPAVAADHGTVVAVGRRDEDRGIYVVVDHGTTADGRNYRTCYQHLEERPAIKCQ